MSKSCNSGSETGECPFCKTFQPLCESHILPLWLLKDRNLDQGFFEYASDSPFKRKIPQGWKQPLLCRSCEDEMQIYDDYSAKFFRGAKSWRVEMPHGHKIFVVEKFDYGLLKLFVMSVLWRAAVSTHHAFHEVQLEPESLEHLYQMLRARNPGLSTDFGVEIYKYVPKNGIEKVTVAPHAYKHDGLDYFQLQFNEFPCRIQGGCYVDGRPLLLSDKSPLLVKEVPIAAKRLELMIDILNNQKKLLEEFRNAKKQSRGKSGSEVD